MEGRKQFSLYYDLCTQRFELYCIRTINKLFIKYKVHFDPIIFSDGALFKLNELEFMPFGHIC